MEEERTLDAMIVSLLSKHRPEHFDGVLLFELADVIIKLHFLRMMIPEVLEES